MLPRQLSVMKIHKMFLFVENIEKSVFIMVFNDRPLKKIQQFHIW